MDLRSELAISKDGWVDGSLQLALHRRDLPQQLIKRDLSGHHEVDVAFGFFLSPGKRAIHEGELNAFGKWSEGLPKQVEHSSGLGEQGMQLRKDRMSAVGTVEHLVLAVITKDEASGSQCGELALNSSYASIDVPSELPYKEGSFWFVIESRKDSSPRLTEEQITKGIRVRSHSENNCTHNENALNKVISNFHIEN